MDQALQLKAIQWERKAISTSGAKTVYPYRKKQK